MPAILAFLRAFVSAAVLYPLVARVLVALGVSVVTYAGVSALVGVIETHIASGLGSLSSSGVALFRLGNLDRAMSVVMSAYVARLTLNGLTAGGILKRVMWTGNGPVLGGS